MSAQPFVIIVLALAFLICSVESRAVWTVATGAELTQHPNRKYLEVAIQSQRQRVMNWRGSLGMWSASAHLCGSAILGARWTVDLGLCYGGADLRLSTAWRYRGGLWYSVNRKWGIGLLHFSNGRTAVPNLGLNDVVPHGSRDSENDGLNFLLGQHRW